MTLDNEGMILKRILAVKQFRHRLLNGAEREYAIAIIY